MEECKKFGDDNNDALEGTQNDSECDSALPGMPLDIAQYSIEEGRIDGGDSSCFTFLRARFFRRSRSNRDNDKMENESANDRHCHQAWKRLGDCLCFGDALIFLDEFGFQNYGIEQGSIRANDKGALFEGRTR